MRIRFAQGPRCARPLVRMPGQPARRDRCVWCLLGRAGTLVLLLSFGLHLHVCVPLSAAALLCQTCIACVVGRPWRPTSERVAGGTAAEAQQQTAEAETGGPRWGVAAHARVGDASVRRAWGIRSLPDTSADCRVHRLEDGWPTRARPLLAPCGAGAGPGCERADAGAGAPGGVDSAAFVLGERGRAASGAAGATPGGEASSGVPSPRL